MGALGRAEGGQPAAVQHRRGVQRVVGIDAGRGQSLIGQPVQQLSGLGQVGGQPRESLVETGPAIGQQRQHLVAQEVAVMPGVVVARVLQEVQAMLPGMGGDGGAGNTEQRPRQQAGGEGPLRRHPGQSAHPGAAQHLQQHRLGLVVAMVGGDQHLAVAETRPQPGVAGPAQRRLGGAAIVHQPVAGEGDAEVGADRRAVRRPACRIRVHGMVQVQRRQARRRRQRGQGVQQHVGIDAAAEGNAVVTPQAGIERRQPALQAVRQGGRAHG